MPSLSPPLGGHVDLVSVLLGIKKEVDAGRPLWLFTGENTAQSLVSYVQGFCAALHVNELENTRYQAFVRWLREEKGAFPGEGWAAKILRDVAGDELLAVRRFLDYVDEFSRLQSR